MIAQEGQFAVQTQNGIVTAIGRFSVYHPLLRYNGGEIRWYQDQMKPAQAEMRKEGQHE